MNSIETSALLIIALGASLMLVPAPNSAPDALPIGAQIPVRKEPAALNEAAISSRPKRAQSSIIKRHEAIPLPPDIPTWPVATTPMLPAKDRAPVLYAELARIAELENLPVDMALAELLPMLSDNDPVIRLAALEALADMSHPARSSMLAAALDDPLPEHRIAALEALATRDDATAWTYIEPYLFDADAEVRVAAIEALAVLESELSVHSLAGLLSAQEQLIRHHAVNAMGEIGGQQAKLYLQQARYDTSPTIRANAEAILAELE